MFILPFHTKNFETKFLYMPSKILTTPQTSIGVPSAYQGLLDANPYRGLQYKKSPWQNFLSKLGFRTEADAWQENMQVQAQEYDSALQAKIYDEQYNDPASQVQRMKAAGLNPDLDPSSIESNQASPFGEDPSTPMETTGDEGQVMQFANGLMSILTTSIGMVESFQGLERNRLQNRLLATQDESAMADFAKQMAPFLLDPLGDTINEDGSMSSWSYNSRRIAEVFSRGMSKSTRSRFLNSIEGIWAGAAGQTGSYDELKKNLESRFGYQVTKNTLLDEAGQISKIITDELGDLSKELLTLRSKAEKSTLQAEQAEGEYNAEYYKELDPALAADVANQSNEFNARNLKMSDTLNQHLDNIIEKIQNASDQGGFKGGLASIALSMLAVFRLAILSNAMPSISQSSSRGGWMTDRGQGSNMGSSFSIGW